jgi:energy-coupling factor transporter ATP-binding protein EcfA2
MPLKTFEILDIEGIRSARCSQVNSIMIIAGPNGVGKSTLLDKLNELMRGTPVVGCRIDKTEDTKAYYVGPNRTPTPFPIHRMMSHITQERRLIDAMSLPAYSISSPMGNIPNMPYWLSSGNPRTPGLSVR